MPQPPSSARSTCCDRFISSSLKTTMDTMAGGGASFLREFGDDVLRRVIDDGMRRIQSQAVEVKFANPVGRILGDEVANWPAVWAIEINGVAPVRLVLGR